MSYRGYACRFEDPAPVHYDQHYHWDQSQVLLPGNQKESLRKSCCGLYSLTAIFAKIFSDFN